MQSGQLAIDEATIIDQWESMSTGEWKKDRVNTSVVVCKVAPDGIRRCPVHRVFLQKKQLGVRAPDGSLFNVSGLFCPSCMDFFVEQKNASSIAEGLSRKHIPSWIQPLSVTLGEWSETIEPILIDGDEPIYIPDTWVDGKEQCPIHSDQYLERDSFVKRLNSQQLQFDAWYCVDCRKILQRNSEAQELQDRAVAMGFRPFELIPLRAERKAAHQHKMEPILPDYFMWGEKLFPYETKKNADWDRLTEEETLVIGETSNCSQEDHITENVLAVIPVQKRPAGSKRYLMRLGYCGECDRYYIEDRSFQLIAGDGRLGVTLIDDTGNITQITSGQEFVDERNHLKNVEDGLDRHIRAIKARPGYVESYATTYYYDDGNLKYAKQRSAPWHEEVAQVDELKPQPYKNRVDLVAGDETRTYYLGLKEIKLEGVPPVDSSLSKLGRDLVNYRTTEITLDQKKWKVRRRREFDIERQVLYGYLEQSDEDFLFQHGITDPFLREVLKQRKRHHQLLDIISTIQENQNQIIDEPYHEDLIVQGCAGSGKTMVLLHRLSVLKQDDSRHFDAGSTVILTPNSNFNTHINGLAANLQLGMIARFSVEEYYRRLLREYDSSLAGTVRLADEMTLDKELVQRIYSDTFLFRISDAFETQWANLLTMKDRVSSLAENLGLRRRDARAESGTEMLQLLQREAGRAGEEISRLEADYRRAQQNLDSLNSRNSSSAKKVEEDRMQLAVAVSQETEKARAEIMLMIGNYEEKLSRIIADLVKIETLIDQEEQTIILSEKMQEEAMQTSINDALKQAAAVLEGHRKNIEQIENTVERYREEQRQQEALQKSEEESLNRRCEEVRASFNTRLREVEEVQRERVEKLSNAVEVKREEYRSLERRILVTRKAEKLAILQSEIDQRRNEREAAESSLQSVQSALQSTENQLSPGELFELLHDLDHMVEGIPEMAEELSVQVAQSEKSTQKAIQLRKQSEDAQSQLIEMQSKLKSFQKILQEQEDNIVTIDTFPMFLRNLQPILQNTSAFREPVHYWREECNNAKERLSYNQVDHERRKLAAAIINRLLAKLQEIHQIPAESVNAENAEVYFVMMEGAIPTATEHRKVIQEAMRKLDADQRLQEELKSNLAKAEEVSNLAQQSRVSEQLRKEYNELSAQVAAINAKRIYDECYGTAMTQTIQELSTKYNRAFSIPRGTYRFDLYLRLYFAMRFFNRAAGTDRFICIDEGQDLAKNEYKLIRDVNERQAVFNIYGDTNQLLRKERGVESWELLSDLFPAAKHYSLNENYRNTNQITQFCNDTFHMTVAKTGADGRKVKEIDRSHFAESLGKLTLREDRFSIILPRKVDKQHYLDGEKLPRRIEAALGNEIGSGRITLAYVDEVKGIEFDRVFVVPNGMSKNEKYIAYTRALSSLTLVLDRSIPEITEEIMADRNTGEKTGDNRSTELADYSGVKVGRVVKRKRR